MNILLFHIVFQLRQGNVRSTSENSQDACGCILADDCLALRVGNVAGNKTIKTSPKINKLVDLLGHVVDMSRLFHTSTLESQNKGKHSHRR